MNKFLAAWLYDSIWKGIKVIRGGKLLTYFTTNDLDASGRVKKTYLDDRIRERKRQKDE